MKKGRTLIVIVLIIVGALVLVNTLINLSVLSLVNSPQVFTDDGVFLSRAPPVQCDSGCYWYPPANDCVCVFGGDPPTCETNEDCPDPPLGSPQVICLGGTCTPILPCLIFGEEQCSNQPCEYMGEKGNCGLFEIPEHLEHIYTGKVCVCDATGLLDEDEDFPSVGDESGNRPILTSLT